MRPSLEDVVRVAIDEALPEDWPRLSERETPRSGTARVLSAFKGSGPQTARAGFGVAVIPGRGPLAREEEADWLALRDAILCRDLVFVLFREEAGPGRDRSWQDFTSERFRVDHPGILVLPAFETVSGTWVVEPTFGRVETLADTLHALWSATLYFVGPVEGEQEVGLELMTSACWKCRASLKTVTGIVFPDRRVLEWQNTDWQYFNGLAPLASLDLGTIEILRAAITAWRAEDRSITPVEHRWTRGTGTSYWAATCPECQAVRGNFPVMEERMGHLHDLETRRAGVLSYRPLEVSVNYEMLETLHNETEICLHSRLAGWTIGDDEESL